MYKNKKICLIVPCYKVKKKIQIVLDKVPKIVDQVILVNDCCPEKSTDGLITKNKNVKIIRNQSNIGVGGAVKAGFKIALAEHYDLIIKVDGDDQMDLDHMKSMCEILIKNNLSYVKGNRFYYLQDLDGMPLIRIIGNSVLSFFSKFSSGYWDIFDPTNGYFVIDIKALKLIQFEKLSNRYFFESDLLFRLRLINATIYDYPMRAVYSDEKSSLRIYSIIFPLLFFHCRNFIKRFFYCYILRETSVATFELIFSIIFIFFGLFIGLDSWVDAYKNQSYAPTGSIVLSSTLSIAGLYLFLSFINYDIISNPNKSHTK